MIAKNAHRFQISNTYELLYRECCRSRNTLKDEYLDVFSCKYRRCDTAENEAFEASQCRWAPIDESGGKTVSGATPGVPKSLNLEGGQHTAFAKPSSRFNHNTREVQKYKTQVLLLYTYVNIIQNSMYRQVSGIITLHLC